MLRWTIVATVPMLVCAGCGSLSRALMNAGWRDRWQQPEAVIQALSLKPGDRVADLGAGGGTLPSASRTPWGRREKSMRLT